MTNRDGPSLRELAGRGTIHFAGIGGAGMSALAEAVLKSGGAVTGCDLHPGAETRRLASLGIRVHEGHDPSHLEETAGLVVSAALPPGHAEIEEAKSRGIPVLKRARALGSWVNPETVIAVAGTHGKTSTTALIAVVLEVAGRDPTAFVGGRVAAWGGNFRHGESDLQVVEADEYDRSFLELDPDVAVVTNVDADHLDIYGDLDGVRAAFRAFLERVSGDGRVVVCGDDPEASRLLPAAGERGYAYGLNPGVQLRAVDVSLGDGGSSFRVVEDGWARGEAALAVPGLHNVRNALAAVAVARALDVEWNAIREGLSAYRGVGRRFQRLGRVGDVEVVDDYAHHPTEVRATLHAARAAHPRGRLVAVFQPHLYSRTRDFHQAFGEALALADEAWITDVYPAREEPIPGITGKLVAEAAQSVDGPAVRYHPELEGLAAEVAASLRPGDLCLTLGAGSVEAVGPEILKALEASGSRSRGSAAAGGGSRV